MHIRHFPLDFLTSTTFDNQVEYLASEMKFASRRSFTAFSAASAFSGDCLRLCCTMALAAGSMASWWQATSGSSLGISAALHAKRSAFSRRQALSCFFARSGRSAPILTHLLGSSLRGTSSNSPSGIGRSGSASPACPSTSSFVNLVSRSTELTLGLRSSVVLGSSIWALSGPSLLVVGALGSTRVCPLAAALWHLLAALISLQMVATRPRLV